MYRLALILSVVGALVAPAVWADPTQTGNWTRSCQANQITKSLEGGQFACYTPAAGASIESASPTLEVSDCENVDIFMWDDYDGDGTACTVTWDIDTCPPGNFASDAIRNTACTTLPGITSLSGVDVESNLAAMWIRVHGENAGANIDSCRIVVKCAQAAQK